MLVYFDDPVIVNAVMKELHQERHVNDDLSFLSSVDAVVKAAWPLLCYVKFCKLFLIILEIFFCVSA